MSPTTFIEYIKHFAFLPKTCCKCGRTFWLDFYIYYFVRDTKRKKNNKFPICRKCWEFPEEWKMTIPSLWK